MTAAEYGSMENQAMAALQQLREKGVSRDDIGILMSREVYDMAKAGGNSAYAVSVENFRAIYWGYDIYVIAEDSPPIFSPVITRFSDNFGVLQFDAGTFLISESDDGTLRVYTKPTQEHAFSAKLSSPYAKHIKWRELPSQTGFVPDRSGNGGNGGRGCICLCTNGLTGCRIPHFSLIFSPVSQPGANLSGSLTR